ncbi:hypothetical protein F2P56_019755 [Juglans regia]|uniref:RING-type domain-containing protein n=2 Tax=Juglans regia TaxID=51240 RepID=A0A833THD0_JUGRE|nr:uncharacterized protein LOC109000292 isoform X1 [Juglans regia]KAF5459841.1 hypothetical protein F2P56_019755 [Juglans regia]
MVSDSITTASIPPAQNARDFGKKKRAHRSAKLKQCKLDARREQWLSQSKNKGCKDENNGGVQRLNGGNRSLEDLEMNSRGEEMDGSIRQYSDLDSPSNSPISEIGSVLGAADSGTNFTGSSSSGSSSSGGSCSGCITEDEEGGGEDDGCLDDWEAVADALAADEDCKGQSQNPCSESPPQGDSVGQVVSPSQVTDNSMGLGGGIPKPECPKTVPGAWGNSRAWRPDDAFRPESLPNLSKQQSLPNPHRHYSGGIAWACNSAVPAPSSCPVCYEDLDFTDSSFLPCLCGFRLCLFCHKRIIEEDGRCPGCRKPYENPVEVEASVNEGSLTFRLARSCSMITRS